MQSDQEKWNFGELSYTDWSLSQANFLKIAEPL